MAEPDIRYARGTGASIAYEVRGDGHGVDVLRIAAFISNLLVTFKLEPLREMGARLASLGRLVSFDSRGTGLSDRVRGARLPTLEERMDDIRAVLDDAAMQRVVVVCFADGGPLGCLFAATYAERTIALVLCNTRPRFAWAPDYPWGLRPEEIEHDIEDITRRWGTLELAEESADEAPWDGVTREERVAWELEMMRMSAAPGDAALAFQMYCDSDARGVLSTIRVPTLVLSRGGDAGREAAAFASAIPGARHEIMPGTAALVMAEHRNAYIDAIEAFVAGVVAEEAELESELATVLFTDVVDSTTRQAQLGDARWAVLVEEHHRVIRHALGRYRGRELDTAGDGFFAAFDGPARAIRCARAIVEGVEAIGVEVRVGLHTGECRVVDGKPGGLAVSIGARVASLAGPSEIFVSQTVRDLIAGSGIQLADRGAHELKGVPGVWRVYAVA